MSRLKVAIVEALESACDKTHWLTHHQPLVRVVPVCWLAGASFKLDQRWGTDTVDAWESALNGGLSEIEAKKVLNGFASGTKPTVFEFQRAKRRLFPPEKCATCDDTGQLWDGERYEFCRCDMGTHMAEVNARIASESTALRPVWAAALPEQARRYDGNVVTLERLCGQCGTPLASHTEGDRKFCDTLAPKGGSK